MKSIYAVILGLFILGFSLSSNGQACIDQLRINPTYPCPDLDYNPVCGCDEVTYRNLCYAINRSGVNYYRDGTCSGFELDVFPNVVSENMVLKITLSQAAETSTTFMLVDVWGKIFIQRQLPAVKRFEFQLDEIIYIPRGTYIALVYNTAGNYRYQKFVRQ